MSQEAELTDDERQFVLDCIHEGASRVCFDGVDVDDPCPDDLRWALAAAYDAIEELSDLLDHYDAQLHDRAAS